MGASRAEVVEGDRVIEVEDYRVRLRPLLERPRLSSQYKHRRQGPVKDGLVFMLLLARMLRHPILQ